MISSALFACILFLGSIDWFLLGQRPPLYMFYAPQDARSNKIEFTSADHVGAVAVLAVSIGCYVSVPQRLRGGTHIAMGNAANGAGRVACFRPQRRASDADRRFAAPCDTTPRTTVGRNLNGAGILQSLAMRFASRAATWRPVVPPRTVCVRITSAFGLKTLV